MRTKVKSLDILLWDATGPFPLFDLTSTLGCWERLSDSFDSVLAICRCHVGVHLFSISSSRSSRNLELIFGSCKDPDEKKIGWHLNLARECGCGFKS